MDLLQTIELGAVLSVSDPSTETENEGVSVQGIEVTAAEQYKAICDTLENVFLVLTGSMQTDLKTEQVSEWVDTLQWALAVIPKGYERQHEIIKAELDYWQSFL